MREEWKSVLMKHGGQFVITFLHGDGILQKQMSFVNSWDSLELVKNLNCFLHGIIMHSTYIFYRKINI